MHAPFGSQHTGCARRSDARKWIVAGRFLLPCAVVCFFRLTSVRMFAVEFFLQIIQDRLRFFGPQVCAGRRGLSRARSPCLPYPTTDCFFSCYPVPEMERSVTSTFLLLLARAFLLLCVAAVVCESSSFSMMMSGKEECFHEDLKPGSHVLFTFEFLVSVIETKCATFRPVFLVNHVFFFVEEMEGIFVYKPNGEVYRKSSVCHMRKPLKAIGHTQVAEKNSMYSCKWD